MLLEARGCHTWSSSRVQASRVPAYNRERAAPFCCRMLGLKTHSPLPSLATLTAPRGPASKADATDARTVQAGFNLG